MAFRVNFYEFAKNSNSTKRPEGSGTVFDCELIAATSVVEPRIQLVYGGNPTKFNYAFISEFNDRYYFVEDWTWNKGKWSAHLKIDALATWKGSIGATSQYVLRAASESDGDILDKLYPIKGGTTFSTQKITPPWVGKGMTEGYYVVGIINDDPQAVGSVSYYVFTQPEMRALYTKLMSDADWLNIPTEEISKELTKSLFNPLQYIASCIWLPVLPPEGEAVTTLSFGWWTFNVTGHRLSSQFYKILSFRFDLPKHPQAATRGAFLNMAPYSSYLLDFRPFGQVELDSLDYIHADSVHLAVVIDCVTGDADLVVSPTGDMAQGDCFMTTKFGVPVQLSQITRDYFGMISNVVGAGAGAVGSFVTGDIGGGIASAASGIASAVEASIPKMLTKGSNGNFVNFQYQIQLIATFRDPIEEDNEHRGRPLCKKKKISTLSGYIMTADADIDIAATSEEIRAIKSAMNGGFYFE